jgi:hypothetical protein
MKCKHDFRVKVELFLDIPLSMRNRLNKGNLRKRDVRVEGANWPTAYTYCAKCGARP